MMYLSGGVASICFTSSSEVLLLNCRIRATAWRTVRDEYHVTIYEGPPGRPPAGAPPWRLPPYGPPGRPRPPPPLPSASPTPAGPVAGPPATGPPKSSPDRRLGGVYTFPQGESESILRASSMVHSV